MPTPTHHLSHEQRRVSRGIAILFLALVTASVGCNLMPIATKPEAKNIAPAVVAAASPDSGLVPLTVRFSGAAADSDGSIASYLWSFGDGESSKQLANDHIYRVAGTYTATLVATDDRGATASSTVMIHATLKDNQPPTATASATPTSGAAPLAVTFSGAGIDPDGSVTSYAWSFGDGAKSTRQNPSHSYAAAGSYDARLTVTDNQGATGSASVTISATGTANQAPAATASASPTTGAAPLAVSFTGTGSDADGTIVSYNWAFGDGGTSTQQNPSHSYVAAGGYTARLTVTDNQGGTGTATVGITATGSTNLAPLANAGVDQLNRDPGLAILLSGAGSSDPDGSITGYAWTQVAGPSVTLTGASTASPSFLSPATTTASYSFRLSVTDNGSPARTGSDTVVVSTRVTYDNAVGALLLARGKQANGQLLGCTSSGCHTASGGLSPLGTYAQVFSVRSSVKSKISSGGSMLKFLLAAEAQIIISWVNAGAPQKN